MPGAKLNSRTAGYVTATDIYKYVQCPHWPFYDRYATAAEKKLKRRQSEGELKRQEDGVMHEARVVAELFAGRKVERAPETKNLENDFRRTLEWMRQGVQLIYHGTLLADNWAGRPDILERQEGESTLGAWHYVPRDVKSSQEIAKYQKFQLAFYAELLEKIQGALPREAGIINIEGVCLPFDSAGIRAEFSGFMRELEAAAAGTKPEPVLRKGCYDVGPWGKLCERTAQEADDIAQLYNVNVPKLRALRSLGVHTVAEAARLDPDGLAGAAPGLTRHGLEAIRLQAASLQDRSVIIRKPAELHTRGLEIHFDIESYPPEDFDYLYGFLLRGPQGDEYLPFTARNKEGEGEMWRAFLKWLETLPLEYTVYHYSGYELMRLSVMENRYGPSHWLDLFRQNMVDLSETVKHGVTFPLYFYGLKHVAKFLGFEWRGKTVKSGGESIDQFEKYLETGDEKILKAIIKYNEDDVRATAHLKDWLDRYAREAMVYNQPYPWTGARS